MTTPSTASPGFDPTPLTAADAARLEVVKDLVDEIIDLTLNYRQTGHPGGSRSKVHFVLATLLSGAMRWDVLRPWRPFSDRFVLSAGHTVPLVYAIARHPERGAARPPRPRRRRPLRLPGRRPLGPDLGGPAHLPAPRRPAGPRGDGRQDPAPQGQHRPLRPRHASPPGEALALKLAGCGEVKVFVVEGEGGLTPGVTHETLNSAWGLGLDNLVFLVDWNDFGIDATPSPRSSTARPRTGSARTAGACWAPRRAWPGSRSCARPWRRRAVTTPAGLPTWPGSGRARAAATASTTRPPTASRTR